MASTSQDGAGDYEEKWDEDGDGEGTENVNQHVRVTAFPENCTQHFCWIKPENDMQSIVRLRTHVDA